MDLDPDAPLTARELRAVYRTGGPFLDEEALDRIDGLNAADEPAREKGEN